MSINDLLVHMDNGAECRSRLATAIGLAVSHEVHLTGLFVITRPYIPTYMEVQLGPEILEAEAAAAAAAAAKVEAVFREEAEKAGIAHEWRAVEGEVVDTVALHARYCDVAVVGQRNPDGVSAEGMPDRLVLSVGRPVLVVPYVGDYPAVGGRVMVAWDGSRLATRAVHDAMPFMLGARQVTVMAVNPTTGPADHGAIPGADLCRHLARHGINAEASHITAEKLEVGDMLLSRAADAGIDLLVMGAYGRARWRELVLGGVTRHMLDHMTMPVLMSH